MTRKVLYFAIVSKDFGGIEQKIIGQFDSLKNLNIDLSLILICKFKLGSVFQQEIDKREGIEVLVNSSNNISNPWKRRKEKFNLISNTLKKYDPEDTIVYFRDPWADINFKRFLKNNSQYLFFTEHQDIENTLLRGKIRGRLIINALEILWGKQYRRYVTGLVGVTEEITCYEKKVAKGKRHYFKTIGNGIDLKKYPLRTPGQDPENSEIRILFVGSGFRTHGVDRLIKSIDSYLRANENPRQIILKVAGDSHEMHLNKRLVNRLGLSAKVIFTGNLDSSDLDHLFDWATVGVGSLGIHRKGLKLTSELKAREYCARGLPFFWSTNDSDFIPGWPYILQIPENNRRFNMDPIISFADRMKADRSHHIIMRQYASEHLDWNVKIRELVSFFEEVIKLTNTKG